MDGSVAARGPMTRILPLPSAALLATCLVTAIAAPRVAHAQDAEQSPGRRLFVEGRKLAQDGKYAEACPKLEESLRLEVGVGTQFNLADCWEHIGRTASARALFLGAAASAKAAGQSDREQVLRERAAALEPRLSRLVIEVVATDPKLSVKRDDLPLESDSFGKAVAIDPGKYTIKARAPGKQEWQKIVEVKAGTLVVTVEVPELKALKPTKPAAEAASEPTSVSAPMKAPAPASPAEADRGTPLNYGALTVAGLGVGALTVGAVMGIKFRNANGDAKDICPSNHGCSIQQIQDHDRLVDDARSARAWSYAGFTAGGLGLAGAGLLWFFQRPSKTKSNSSSASASWQAAPVVAADGSLGAMLNARF
jgi:hypothetical protein